MANEKKYYRDFRAHLTALEERGKLVRIKREINKDTELMPLVRWQFRGLEERDRKAFMFENVVDSKGRRFVCRSPSEPWRRPPKFTPSA